MFDRTFDETEFQVGGTTLFEKTFSLTNPSTGQALGVSTCNSKSRLILEDFNPISDKQKFKLTANDQIESVHCQGKVISVGMVSQSWLCKKDSSNIGEIALTREMVARMKCYSESGM